RFLAYRDEKNSYFVTDSGQVHYLPRHGNPRRTALLWGDPDRPVRLLISDTVPRRAFAFALRQPWADPRKKPDVCFVLQPKLKPLPTEAPKLRWTSPEWRAGIASQYAHFLLRQKLLEKGPAPAVALYADKDIETLVRDFQANTPVFLKKYKPSKASDL